MSKLIEEFEVQLVEPGCAPGAARWGVLVSLPNEISEVFPYLNAVLDSSWYDHESPVLIWDGEDGRKYAFRPHEIRVSSVNDIAQAHRVVNELIAKVNQIWQERDRITPRFAERKLPAVMDIFKLLPRTNCGRCGYTACMAFAADLRKRAIRLEQCLPLSEPEYSHNRGKLEELIATD